MAPFSPIFLAFEFTYSADLHVTKPNASCGPGTISDTHPSQRTFEMAVPKRKHSNSRSGKRRSHHSIKRKQTHYCPNCGNSVLSHVVCPKCGFYMGRVVVEMSDEA